LGRNRVMQLALTRLVEIVGEAANRVSQATRQKTPGIPWPQIISMRNRLIHGYDVIDCDLRTQRHQLFRLFIGTTAKSPKDRKGAGAVVTLELPRNA